jgi:repressor LexA
MPKNKDSNLINNLQKLKEYRYKHGRLPSYSQMATLLGLKSKSAVSYQVNKLIKLGQLVKDEFGQLDLKSPHQLKILGSIKAGFPSPAEEELVDTLSLDEFLIEKPNATFMLNYGIVPGDLVIVEKGRNPVLGDIVVAKLDEGDYTLKQYSKDTRGKYFLKSGNKSYPNFYPNSELKIEAVLVSLVRKYKFS